MMPRLWTKLKLDTQYVEKEHKIRLYATGDGERERDNSVLIHFSYCQTPGGGGELNPPASLLTHTGGWKAADWGRPLHPVVLSGQAEAGGDADYKQLERERVARWFPSAVGVAIMCVCVSHIYYVCVCVCVCVCVSQSGGGGVTWVYRVWCCTVQECNHCNHWEATKGCHARCAKTFPDPFHFYQQHAHWCLWQPAHFLLSEPSFANLDSALVYMQTIMNYNATPNPTGS